MTATATTRRVLVLALGETDEVAEALARERFPGAQVEWLHRADLRAHRARSAVRLIARGCDDVVLVVPDLDAPRARIITLLAGAPRARRRWIADAKDRFEPFTLTHHLRTHGATLARHLVAVALARVFARPALTLALRYLDAESRRGWRALSARRPGRVLYLRSQFWFDVRGGGSVAHTAGVIGGLQDRGVAVHVVSTDALQGVSNPTTLVRPERWFDGALKEAEELAFNLPFLLASLAEARRFRPQSLYQRYTAFNVTGALLSRVLRVPLVLEFNSSDVWKGRHWGEFHLLSLAELGERVNLAAADRIVVVSRVLEGNLAAAGVPAAKIVVNPNAVDPSRFRPDVDATPVFERHPELREPGTIMVGFSGTFGAWHGIPTLAQALPVVAEARPNVRWLLVGDGGLKHLVDESVAAHHLHDRVVMPGLVPHDLMPAYLAACDVLVSPHGRQADGREFFGSPTKLYEYMAAGRAIVASAVGQIGDVLRDGETALLVPPEDVDALANAIIRLVDDADLRRRLGTASRAAAEREHTWRRNAERVLAAVESGPSA